MQATTNRGYLSQLFQYELHFPADDCPICKLNAGDDSRENLLKVVEMLDERLHRFEKFARSQGALGKV